LNHIELLCYDGQTASVFNDGSTVPQTHR